MDESYFPFYKYSNYLTKKYGLSAYRVGIDAGFSCPNRGGDRKKHGCIYCDAGGARATYIDVLRDIEKQIKKGVAFLERRYGAEIFLLYFQAFSNTFGSVENLKKIYEYCLGLHDFHELIVSTRPDCITEGIAKLLASYKNKGFDVWVELGLQSSLDETLVRINRGHTVSQFESSYRLLKSMGIKVAVHLIFGLPGEGEKEIMDSVDYIARLRPDGIKIHNLSIPFDTPVCNEYLYGELSVPSRKRHLEYTIKAIGRLPPETIIIRLTCDIPRNRRAFPGEPLLKGRFYNEIRKEMLKRNLIQGIHFSE